jgi:hypothetical protein
MQQPLGQQTEGPAMSAAQRRAALQREVAGFTYPAQLPMFDRFVPAATQELWVSDFHPQGELTTPASWHVFAADGRLLAHVTLPVRFHLFDAGADYVLGVARDDDDVEHVTMLRLQRH